jgi:hypothetical protein
MNKKEAIEFLQNLAMKAVPHEVVDMGKLNDALIITTSMSNEEVIIKPKEENNE